MRVERSKCATFAQNHNMTHCPWTSSCGSCPPPPPRAREGKALPGPHPSWTPVIRSNPLANTSRHVEFFHLRLLHVALGVADSAAIAPAAVVPVSASDGVSVGVVLAVAVVVVSSSCCCCYYYVQLLSILLLLLLWEVRKQLLILLPRYARL